MNESGTSIRVEVRGCLTPELVALLNNAPVGNHGESTEDAHPFSRGVYARFTLTPAEALRLTTSSDATFSLWDEPERFEPLLAENDGEDPPDWRDGTLLWCSRFDAA